MQRIEPGRISPTAIALGLLSGQSFFLGFSSSVYYAVANTLFVVAYGSAYLPRVYLTAAVVGFLFGLVLIGAIRELSGSGTLLGYNILGFRPLLVMILPAGGFFVIGFIMAAFNFIEYKLTGKMPSGGGAH